jgi:cupin 2 domain-containing protein
MHQPFLRGRLEHAEGAPAEGERTTPLLKLPGLLIEQILSGSLPAPRSFLQGHDEWVLMLAGGARMRIGADEIELAAGDWLLLPSGCPHTVLETEAGTSWLALHLASDE